MEVANNAVTVDDVRNNVITTAKKMAEEDIQINMLMGKIGSELFSDNDTIMTHCNARCISN